MINALQMFRDFQSQDREAGERSEARQLQNQLLRFEFAQKQEQAARERQRQNMLAQAVASGNPNALMMADPKLGLMQQRIGLQREAINQRATAAANRPQPPGPTIQTAEGIFERLPNGELRLLTAPGTRNPLTPMRGEKPITEFQGKNALYGSRAAMADQVLNNLEDNINTVALASKQSLQNTPVIGGIMGAIGNAMLPANEQSVEQAQRNFVNAVLRQESGAVISDQEFENAKKQYFRQPGDSDQVVAQKRANRQAAIQGFRRIAGPAWQDPPQTPSSPAVTGGGGWTPEKESRYQELLRKRGAK